MGNKNALILAVIAIGAIVAFKYMARQMVPYVPFAEAVSTGDYVQLMGTIDRKKGISRQGESVRFVIADESAKNTVDVDYAVSQPVQLDGVDKVVVIGTYDRDAKIFRADKILTKCPSKYEKRIAPAAR